MIRRIIGYGLWLTPWAWGAVAGHKYELSLPLTLLALLLTGVIVSVDLLGIDERRAARRARAAQPPPDDR